MRCCPAARDGACPGRPLVSWRGRGKCCWPAVSTAPASRMRANRCAPGASTPLRASSRRRASRILRRCAASWTRCGATTRSGMRMADRLQVPDATGHFGPYGGRFVPETLVHALDELEAAYHAAVADPAFQRELDEALRL